ncbi:tyrosine-type recombinase/integrase [Planctomycetota bacterium]
MVRSFSKVYLEKRKRKKGHTYLLRWRDPCTKKRCTENVGHDILKAERARVKKEQELILRERDPYPEKYSFDDFTKDFREWKGADVEMDERKRDIKVSTIESYLCSLLAFRRAFPKKKYLQDVTKKDVKQYKRDRIREVKGRTVNRELRELKALWNHAKEEEMVKENPFVGVKKVKEEDTPEINVISPEQEGKILRTIDTYTKGGITQETRLKYRCLFLVAMQGGLRSGEVRNLRWQDIDTEAGKISVSCRYEWTSKVRKNRSVFVTLDTCLLLKQLQMITGGSLLDTPFMYKDSSTVATMFRRISDRAKVTFSLQDCRRTCASRMAEAGVPIQVTKEYMGHANISTTQRYYTKISDEAKRKAMIDVSSHTHRKPGKVLPRIG